MTKRKLEELFQPFAPVLKDDIERVVGTSSEIGDAPRTWWHSVEDLMQNFGTVAASNPWWVRDLVMTVFTDKAKTEFLALTTEEMLDGDEAAIWLYKHVDALAQVDVRLPVHFYRYVADPIVRELGSQVGAQLGRARDTSGERRAVILRRLGADGLFEPIYKAYARALLCTLKIVEGKFNGLHKDFGVRIRELNGRSLPSHVVDADAAFFRNSMAHVQVSYDDRGEILTLINRPENRPEEVKTFEALTLLSRLEQMHRTATESMARAFGTWAIVLLNQIGLFEVIFDAVQRAARTNTGTEQILVEGLERIMSLLQTLGLDGPFAADLGPLIAEIPKSVAQDRWIVGNDDPP